MKVIWLHRSPRMHGNFSIERCFAEMRSGFESLEEPCEIEEIQVPHPTSGWLSMVRNVLFCLRLRADLAHVSGDIHYVMPFIRARRKVLTIHDLGMLTESNAAPWKRFALRVAWFTIPLRFCHAVACVSPFSLDRLNQLFPNSKGQIRLVIPTAIPQPLKPVEATPRVPSEPFRVLQIGTQPNKNAARIWRALHGLPAKLFIVGQPTDELKRLEEQCPLEHEFHISISDAELEELYSASDLVAFASTHEGFGMPLIEAQLHGVPCITSHLEPMKSNAGDGALLVDPSSDEQIRAGIIRLMNEPQLRQELVIKGRENAQRFTGRRVAEDYQNLYNALIERPD